MKKRLNSILNIIICTGILLLASLVSNCQERLDFPDWQGVIYKQDGKKWYEVVPMTDGTFIETYDNWEGEWQDASSLEGCVFMVLFYLKEDGFQHLYFNWFDNRFEVIQCKTGEIIILSDAGKISFGNFEVFRYYLMGFLIFQGNTSMYDY